MNKPIPVLKTQLSQFSIWGGTLSLILFCIAGVIQYRSGDADVVGSYYYYIVQTMITAGFISGLFVFYRNFFVKRYRECGVFLIQGDNYTVEYSDGKSICGTIDNLSLKASILGNPYELIDEKTEMTFLLKYEESAEWLNDLAKPKSKL